MKYLAEQGYPCCLINDLCKHLRHTPHLLEPVLAHLVHARVVTDSSLFAFLAPDRRSIELPGVQHIRNSTFKLIGMHCPALVTVNLSDCTHLSNAVVRSILSGCRSLKGVCGALVLVLVD